MITDKEWELFKEKYPLIAKLAEAIEAKGLKIVWDERCGYCNNFEHCKVLIYTKKETDVCEFISSKFKPRQE